MTMRKSVLTESLILSLGIILIIVALVLKWNSLREFARQGYCHHCGRLTASVLTYTGTDRISTYYYCQECEASAPSSRLVGRGDSDNDARFKRVGWDGLFLGLLGGVMFITLKDMFRTKTGADMFVSNSMAAVGVVYLGLGFACPPLSWIPILGVLSYVAALFFIFTLMEKKKTQTAAPSQH
jgi:hypothetical protein